MNALVHCQQVELFHLTFLRFLEQAIPKNSYALKGGCNLRFFFKSIRYSEDIDLDIWSLPKDKLEGSVKRVFESKLFVASLLSSGLEVLDFRAPKQTETTQRWKMSIRYKGSSLQIPTKIEFSRRVKEAPSAIKLDPVDPEIVSTYKFPPVLVMHYSGEAAIAQKLNALVHRAEPQARDVFDLYMLLQRGHTLPKTAHEAPQDIEHRLLQIDHDTFSSQVLSYLEPQYQDFYGSKTKWEEIQLNILEHLSRT